jgi:hypothetical protein
MYGNPSNRLLPKPSMNFFVITVVHWPSCSANVFDIVVVFFGSLLSLLLLLLLLLLLFLLSARRCSRLDVVELTLLHVLFRQLPKCVLNRRMELSSLRVYRLRCVFAMPQLFLALVVLVFGSRELAV